MALNSPVIISSISDLLINLSAGWFGVAVIIPPILSEKGKISFILLLADVVFGRVALLVAIELRKNI